MDPVSLGIMAVGAGLQLYGGYSQAGHAKQISQLANQKASQEQEINNLKLQQMEVEGRRMQMENIRNTQRARAMAVQAGTNQGAQFGTGLLGGIAEVQNKGEFNMQGVEQGLFFGREVAQRNNNISALNAQISQAQGAAASDQGWSSLGGALIKAGPFVGQMSQGFGSGYQQSMNNPYDSMPQAFGNNSWWQNA